jgi:hypothetical protein
MNNTTNPPSKPPPVPVAALHPLPNQIVATDGIKTVAHSGRCLAITARPHHFNLIRRLGNWDVQVAGTWHVFVVDYVIQRRDILLVRGTTNNAIDYADLVAAPISIARRYVTTNVYRPYVHFFMGGAADVDTLLRLVAKLGIQTGVNWARRSHGAMLPLRHGGRRARDRQHFRDSELSWRTRVRPSRGGSPHSRKRFTTIDEQRTKPVVVIPSYSVASQISKCNNRAVDTFPSSSKP